MAYNFLPVDRDQRFLLPVDMADWLPRDHFGRFLVELVEALDTSPFLSAYRTDGRGAAAHHPTMMATLLIYAYCDGERSSRRIEERCRTDVAYRYLTGGLVPDHSTVARFRDRHEKELAGLFLPVLAVCLRAGIGDTSFAAVDGTKFRCPASLRANRTLESIEKELAALTEQIETELARVVAEILAESRRADLADTTLPGTPPDPPRQPGTLPPVAGLPKALHCTARPPAAPGSPGPRRPWTTSTPPTSPPTTPGSANEPHGSPPPAKASAAGNRNHPPATRTRKSTSPTRTAAS